MDTLHDLLGLLRLGTLREVYRDGERAHLTVIPPDRGPAVVLALEGCSELAVVPVDGGQPITDAQALTRLRLQLLHVALVDGEWTVWVSAAPRTAVRGGRLRVRATAVQAFEQGGRALSRSELVARVQVATGERLRTQSAASYRSALDRVLRSEVRPLLIAAGFTAERRVFRRARAGLIDVITFEIGRFATAESLSFTLRLDVYVGDLGRKSPTEQMLTASAYPAYRRTLEPEYTLAGDVDESGLAARLRDDLVRVALPGLERFGGPDDVIAFLLDEDRREANHRRAFTVANLFARRGDLAEARRWFAVAEGDAAAIRRVAASYGIDL